MGAAAEPSSMGVGAACGVGERCEGGVGQGVAASAGAHRLAHIT